MLPSHYGVFVAQSGTPRVSSMKDHSRSLRQLMMNHHTLIDLLFLQKFSEFVLAQLGIGSPSLLSLTASPAKLVWLSLAALSMFLPSFLAVHTRFSSVHAEYKWIENFWYQEEWILCIRIYYSHCNIHKLIDSPKSI